MTKKVPYYHQHVECPRCNRRYACTRSGCMGKKIWICPSCEEADRVCLVCGGVEFVEKQAKVYCVKCCNLVENCCGD